ncbi:diguanylate cyclase [Marinomonas algicola]|uniref:diguanylate cyclase n=1 Tax=Marinomonas algicola TaxID=2773454 RepID=UPI00174CF521|nr:diguanylate cyclase [Marinomonas algicola]
MKVLFWVIVYWCSAITHASTTDINLNQSVQTLNDNGLWYSISNELTDLSIEEIELAFFKETTDFERVNGSIVGSSGSFLSRIHLTSESQQTVFVVPKANFIDRGVVYWQPDQGVARQVAQFSLLDGEQMPRLLHDQSFTMNLDQHDSGSLWIIIQAQHFPTPVPLTFYTQATFYQYLFIINTLTVSSVVIMLMLAVLALAIFFRTKQKLTLLCAGYIGLHGLGWASSSGLINYFFASLSVNLTYAGMYLFPFAVACASLFTQALFNCSKSHPVLSKYLIRFAQTSALMGVVMLFLPFQRTFYLAHLIAAFWVPFSIWIGVKMLSNEDYRAKYYLAGNLCYGLAIVYYSASHLHLIHYMIYPELAVVVALAIDCLCILLSLSEWLKVKQNDFITMLLESRIDPLTKVGNRLRMNEALEALSKPCAVTVIDLDGMKQINDSFGHNEGDRFLQNVAALMTKEVGHFAEVFRTGGDEFVLLVVVDNKEELPMIDQRLHHAILDLESILRESWPTAGISFGVSSTYGGLNSSDCLIDADLKMYQYKEARKNPQKSVGA